MKILKFYLQYWSLRLFYTTFILLIFYGSYCYTVQKIPIGSYMFINPFYHVHMNLPSWTNYLEYFIFIFVISSIVMFIHTNYYAFVKENKEKMRNRYLDFYFNSLISDLFRENKTNDTVLKINSLQYEKYSKKNFYRELITNTLIQIHSQTIGKARQDTELIMQSLHYDNWIHTYLRSPYYKHKKIALDAISEFKLEGYDNYIIKLAKQSNKKLLRTNALIALTRLDVYNNLILLIEMNVKITIWDVNVIINNIEQDNNQNIPYTELIHAKNEGMQILGIMLARINHKIELKQAILEKINDSNSLIMEEAVIAFASFAEDKNDFDFLIDQYKETTEKAKDVIIKTINSDPDKDQTADFLQWIAENEPMQNKLSALISLLSIDISRISKLKRSDDPLVKTACEQILDINV